jgi:hypothetical protein
VFNPQYQRLYQCISHRAVHGPTLPLPPLDPKVESAVQPLPAVVENSREAAAAVKKSFKLERVVKRTGEKRKRGRNDDAVPGDGGAAMVDELIRQVGGQGAGGGIQSVNPVRDFDALVKTRPVDAVRGMMERIVEFAELEEEYWDKAMGCVERVFRFVKDGEEVERGAFNEGLRNVRDAGGGGFWRIVKGKGIGLVECVGVGREEVEKFGRDEDEGGMVGTVEDIVDAGGGAMDLLSML